MENEMGVNTYDVGTLAGLNGIGGFGFNGNQALYETLLTQHTQAEVRREGDQSANRDHFAAAQTVLQGNRQENAFFAAHIDNDRKFAALTAQMTAAQLETAKCCCETQKLVMAENGKTRDLINGQEVDRLRSQLGHAYANMAASTNRSVFVNGDATTSNNSGFQN